VKRFFKNIISLFLSILLLSATSGVTISKMVCLSSGNASYSLTKINDCCEDDSEGIVIKKSCCAFSSTQLDLDVEATSYNKSYNSFGQQVFQPVCLNLLFQIEMPEIEFLVYQSPPPNLPSGKNILILNSTFLI